MVKRRFLALTLCAVLLIFTVAGCGTKASPGATASPKASGASPSGGGVTAPISVTTLIGIADNVGASSITLQLVQPYNASGSITSGTTGSPATGITGGGAAGATGTATGITGAAPSTSPSGTTGGTTSGGSQTIKTTQDLVASGSSLYTLSGTSQVITLTPATTVILESQAYAPGSTGDIAKGDFLAVALSGNTAVVVINNGAANSFASSTGSSTQTGNSGGMEAQPSPSPSGSAGTKPSPNTGSTPSSGSGTQNYIVTTDNLKARSGPGTTYDILGQMTLGSKISGTVTDGWLKFTYNGKTAYCLASYVKLDTSAGTTSPKPSSSTSPTPSASGSKLSTYKVTQADLKIRSGPGTTYDVIGKLALGERVSGTVTSGWLKFTYNGQTAYCSAEYLSVATN